MTTSPGPLDAAFARRAGDALPGVIPYFTAGFPEIDDTPGLLLAAQEAGCLAAEIGIPFSDPMADGPTIQATGTRALANGMTPEMALSHIAEARRQGVTIPLAAMVYSNLVMAHGVDSFAAGLTAAGADALIVPDLPSGEAAEIRDVAATHRLALIPMVAPTTPIERLASVCAGASGFVYCVSVAGTTGARATLGGSAIALLERVRTISALPRALGFGISRHQHLIELAGHAEAVIVGAALLDAVTADAMRPTKAARRFLVELIGERAADA
ncbi:MAG: tryptophan synthase subunit alpha [Candidatus Dormibacteria bacterium]